MKPGCVCAPQYCKRVVLSSGSLQLEWDCTELEKKSLLNQSGNDRRKENIQVFNFQQNIVFLLSSPFVVSEVGTTSASDLMSNSWSELGQQINVTYMPVFLWELDNNSPGARCLTMYGLTTKSSTHDLRLHHCACVVALYLTRLKL